MCYLKCIFFFIPASHHPLVPFSGALSLSAPFTFEKNKSLFCVAVSFPESRLKTVAAKLYWGRQDKAFVIYRKSRFLVKSFFYTWICVPYKYFKKLLLCIYAENIFCRFEYIICQKCSVFWLVRLWWGDNFFLIITEWKIYFLVGRSVRYVLYITRWIMYMKNKKIKSVSHSQRSLVINYQRKGSEF